MIHYVVLSTGSCGNCYVFYDGEDSIIVDCGVTMTKLMNELEAHEIPFSSIRALFLTHLHPDHVKGAGPLERIAGTPTYISRECFSKGKTEILKAKLEIKTLSLLKWGESVSVGSFTVTAFRTSHDSPGSSGYYIEHETSSFFLLTDTGVIPDEAFNYAEKSRVKFIEANYDEEMLSSGPYPEWLKARIRGPYGHLSNRDAVTFAKAVSKRGDQIYFIHPSANNNDLFLIKEEAEKNIESGIFLKCCERGEMFEGFIE